MQGPPGSSTPAVGGFTIHPPSVLIFGNPSLYDVAALSKLGQCSSNPSGEAGNIFIEVCFWRSTSEDSCWTGSGQ